ncbi:MAG TPA: DUF86 domain-containing protein [Terriglobia bacterium]|nr:DUF86 domain-containing protein [Terriglobia bacterium]
MPRDYKVYAEDILESIRRIHEYTRGLSLDGLKKDLRTLDAVVRNLEVIGEAARNIPDQVRIAHSAVDWKNVIGLRNILAHEYFGIDADIIWDIIQNKLAGLRESVQRILDT